MNIIAVDDERPALESIGGILKKTLPDADVRLFRRGADVLACLDEGYSCDIAFLDIEMRGMDGVTCAREIKRRNDSVNIVFTTGYSEYMAEAFEMHASGYLLKPVTAEKIRRELEELRYPQTDVPDPSSEREKKLTVQTFGNFEVFFRCEPLKFLYSKTKELFAYLVDRCGAMCTLAEIETVLWEDEDGANSHRSYLKNLRSDLVSVLTRCGAKDCLRTQRGALGINREAILCDYYDWLEGKNSGNSRYRGEYMSQYSWGEATHAAIEMQEMEKQP